MSVINKMLRDLDQRAQVPDGTAASPQPARMQPSAHAGSNRAGAVPGAASRHRVPSWLLALLAVLLASLSVATWWWQKAAEGSAVPAAQLTQATAQAPASVSAPLATAVAPVPTVAPVAAAIAPSAPAPVAPVAAVTTAPPSPGAAKAALPVAPVPLASASPNASVPVPARAVAPAPVALAPALPVRAAAVVAAPSAPSATVPAEPQGGTTRQLQAGRDALAQAQAQWNAGAHDAATELLQAAIAAVERSSAAAPSAAQTQLLAALVRELARMQLAEGRAGAALETLARQEPQLGREADIWAMRGNAAQRLGKHQDSVQAYSTALQLRPNEQRWMLGSAVSLAALGQTANASDMADRARVLGPISKEVQAYLRLAGVRLTEP